MKKNQCWQFQWTRIVAEVATHSTSFVPPKRGSWGLEQEEVKLFIPFSSPIFSSQLNIGSFSSLIFSSQEVDNYVIVLPAAGGRSGVGRRGDEVVWDIRDIYEIYLVATLRQVLIYEINLLASLRQVFMFEIYLVASLRQILIYEICFFASLRQVFIYEIYLISTMVTTMVMRRFWGDSKNKSCLNPMSNQSCLSSSAKLVF